MGTVGYMSPEQASGHPVDFRSDQFSLGAILYEMATSKRAFERSTAVQTLSAIIQEEPEPVGSLNPKLPTSLVWLIERCLAKDPEERYGSTKDLARDLAAMRDHSSSISTSALALPASRRIRLSRPWLAAGALAAVVFAALAFFGGQKIQARRDREAPRAPGKTLTFRRGFLTGARFAHDGQTIVFSAAWDGKPSEIFTTRADSSESRPLGIFPAGILAISSSGEMAISLGCESRWEPCFGTLARAPLAGGAAREVLDNVGSADWSPDGKDLAIVHVVEGRDRLEYPIGKVLFETDGALSSIRVSPKGDLIAFLELPKRDNRIGIVSIVDRAGRRTKLTETVDALEPLLWSPKGDEIFFNASRFRTREIKAVSLSGRLRSASWIPGLDDVLQDGLFLDTGGHQNVSRDILALVPGAPKERSLSWLADSTAADLSEDGRKLLFYEWAAQAGSGEFGTYLRATDGSDAKLLGDGKALALSPDEKWALASRILPEPHLVLLPTGAGELRSLPGGGILQYHWAGFFPNGRRILIAAEEKGKPPRTYIQDVTGGPPRPFADEGMRAVIVSPDGGEIAGTTLEGLHLIYRTDGQGRARFIEGTKPDDLLVQWSADGKSILVRGSEERPMTLYRIDLATGQREHWKDLAPSEPSGFLEFGAGPRGVRITPDGRFYAYTITKDQEKLILTEIGKDWWK